MNGAIGDRLKEQAHQPQHETEHVDQDHQKDQIGDLRSDAVADGRQRVGDEIDQLARQRPRRPKLRQREIQVEEQCYQYEERAQHMHDGAERSLTAGRRSHIATHPAPATGPAAASPQADLEMSTIARTTEGQSETAKLEKLVAAYREALKDFTRGRAPLDWAVTRSDLGNALAALGEREARTATLEEAVAIYGEALNEFTRERAPLQWATIQNNLGDALATIRKEGEPNVAARRGPRRLSRSAKGKDPRARAARLGHDPERSWQYACGSRRARGRTATLEDAVIVYREALNEFTRERAPLQWATIQNNLGAVLATIGEEGSGTLSLELAVAAYREALKERTRDRAPLDWSMSTGNQGVALMLLAERLGNPDMAKTALGQIDVAFTEMGDADHTSFAAYYEAQLPKAHALVGRLSQR